MNEQPYKILKNWDNISYIKVWDLDLARNVYVHPWRWVPAPDGMPGTYKKSAKGFLLGEENGHYWWSLGDPKMGRFEWKIDLTTISATIQLLPCYRIRVDIFEFQPDIWQCSFVRKRKVFGLADLILELYLENSHDYSVQDMTYYSGNRKYHNELVLL